jgi:hypothetical protein
MSQADIDAFLDASTPEDDAEDDQTVVVWAENADAFRVFQHCQFEKVIGMTGVHYTGITASEIHSVLQTLRIDPERWSEVMGGVRIMVAAALPLMNQRGP